MEVKWSDRLEELAEGMFRAWEDQPQGDPFARTCVVVGDLSTRDWLKDYFLLKRKGGKRRVLANIDFKPLPEFVNDWLAAVCGTDAVTRKPAEHPYAHGVLAWRINSLLKEHAANPELKILADYVSGKTAKIADRRRYDLSVRLAQLFDDYLASRPEMLHRWEEGEVQQGEERWQAVLYRLLVQEVPETYALDFAKALSDESDPALAFEHGFPRYAAVHVFDVMTCPKPYFQMLERISCALPLTFWNFKPSRTDPVSDFAPPDAKLLGALATGSRGLLAAERELMGAQNLWIGENAVPALESLKAVTVEEHVSYSPRRELEAARDALHRFFKETPDAHPSDALVLCADWARYAPLVESVFGADDAEAIPIALASRVADDTPVTHAFSEIFDFRTNRFEVSKVLALLSVPQVRAKFGLDADSLSLLRDMVRKNNIRWGFDDADVKACLGPTAKSEKRPFTWRRGLDRFIADALLGPRPDERDLVSLGKLGRLQPCGRVEDDRAKAVSGLVSFVTKLHEVREFLKGEHAAEEWCTRLLKVVDDFYAVEKESVNELAGLRRAIVSTTRDVEIARSCSGAACKDDPIPGEVMCRAVSAAIGAVTRKVESFGDSVRIAPLKNASAVPARFVWICGLNDGTFPRMEYRPAFDLIGQTPTPFDVTARERDGFALLKAATGARDRLAFSYVGRNIKTNESLPASVSLLDLLDWLNATDPKHVKRYDHPLQAYSPRYFTEGSDLPPCYSKVNRDAAEALVSVTTKSLDSDVRVRPFEMAKDGETIIDLDELVGFYRRPNHFLATKRLGFCISRPQYDLLNEVDALDATASPAFVAEALLNDCALDEEITNEAERMVEEGSACNLIAGTSVLAEAVGTDARTAFHSQRLVADPADREGMRCSCPDEDLAARYLEYRSGEPQIVDIKLSPSIRLTGSLLQTVAMKQTNGREVAGAFAFSEGGFWPSDKDADWIYHLAACAAGWKCVTILLTPADDPHAYLPVAKAEAVERLLLLVKKASEDFSVDMEKARGKDGLPGDYEELLERDAYFR